MHRNESSQRHADRHRRIGGARRRRNAPPLRACGAPTGSTRASARWPTARALGHCGQACSRLQFGADRAVDRQQLHAHAERARFLVQHAREHAQRGGRDGAMAVAGPGLFGAGAADQHVARRRGRLRPAAAAGGAPRPGAAAGPRRARWRRNAAGWSSRRPRSALPRHGRDHAAERPAELAQRLGQALAVGVAADRAGDHAQVGVGVLRRAGTAGRPCRGRPRSPAGRPPAPPATTPRPTPPVAPRTTRASWRPRFWADALDATGDRGFHIRLHCPEFGIISRHRDGFAAGGTCRTPLTIGSTSIAAGRARAKASTQASIQNSSGPAARPCWNTTSGQADQGRHGDQHQRQEGVTGLAGGQHGGGPSGERAGTD